MVVIYFIFYVPVALSFQFKFESRLMHINESVKCCPAFVDIGIVGNKAKILKLCMKVVCLCVYVT